MEKIPGLIKNIESSSSSSGNLYSMERGKNYNFSCSEILSGDSLIFSIENLSSLVNTFRGSGSFQFQIELGPNEAMEFHVPFAPYLILTASNLLKIADIRSLDIDREKEYDTLLAPAGPIKIQSADGSFQKDRWYVASGVSNIFFAGRYSKDDLVFIEYDDFPVVSQFDRLRLFTKSKASYLGKLSQVINLGYSEPYAFRLALLKKKHHKPGYIPPELSLWKLHNEAI